MMVTLVSGTLTSGWYLYQSACSCDQNACSVPQEFYTPCITMGVHCRVYLKDEHDI